MCQVLKRAVLAISSAPHSAYDSVGHLIALYTTEEVGRAMKAG